MERLEDVCNVAWDSYRVKKPAVMCESHGLICHAKAF